MRLFCLNLEDSTSLGHRPHYSSFQEEETDFVQNHLGPTLEANGNGATKILGYDQNRAGLKDWVDSMFKDEASSKYFDGTAPFGLQIVTLFFDISHKNSPQNRSS